MPEQKYCDAVFEGGGIKGIGLAGAIAVTEGLGYEFFNVAGTSAGAIVAALVAAGYRAKELHAIMQTLDYSKFKDEGLLDKIPLIGKIASLGLEKGIYEGAYLEAWIREKLEAKGKRTFKDLVIEECKDSPKYRYKLQVIASDVSRGKFLVLPRDITDYGVDPDELDIAKAVRMSMSIPLFFEPVTLTLKDAQEPCYIVDGGVLSNFPIHLFDDGTADPPWPTFGYLLAESPDSDGRAVSHGISGPFSLLVSIFFTMMEAHDRIYIQNGAFARTIMIPTLGVKATEFELSSERAEALYRSGEEAARTFFRTWDFDRYKAMFREVRERDRSEMLLAAAPPVRV
ncbi:MAG: patatin-like phospholipase family protein [Thermodesulfobacteriota bacterium]|jgi:NTE family protein